MPTIPQTLADPSVQHHLDRPIRELAQVAWMTGIWNARNAAPRVRDTHVRKKASRDSDVTTYVFGLTMKGRWLFGADGKAHDYLYITYDSLAGHWVLVRFQGNPSYGVWLSERGWDGNRIAFLSDASYVNGHRYRRRVTLIHKTARTFGIYDEEERTDGSWLRDGSVELKKQS